MIYFWNYASALQSCQRQKFGKSLYVKGWTDRCIFKSQEYIYQVMNDDNDESTMGRTKSVTFMAVFF